MTKKIKFYLKKNQMQHWKKHMSLFAKMPLILGTTALLWQNTLENATM